jgi:prepilin-type processing-associated H-X9-DG protein
MTLEATMVIVAIVGLAILIFVALAPWRGHEIDHPPPCVNSLSQLGIALLSYAGRYDGILPYSDKGELQSLALLYPEFINVPGPFVCPDARRAKTRMLTFPKGTDLAGSPCSYRYVRGLKLGAPPDTPVMWDLPANHGRKGICVLYLDGHVKWLEGNLDPRR